MWQLVTRRGPELFSENVTVRCENTVSECEIEATVIDYVRSLPRNSTFLGMWWCEANPSVNYLLGVWQTAEKFTPPNRPICWDELHVMWKWHHIHLWQTRLKPWLHVKSIQLFWNYFSVLFHMQPRQKLK